MEITYSTENLSHVDTGGGFRDIKAHITIDSSLSPRRQKEAVLYETLACYLEPMFSGEFVDELVRHLIEALDAIE